MKRISPEVRKLSLVISVCILASLLAFFSTFFIRSPQQQAAEADPPSPSILTATSEERELSQTVVLRGTIGSEYSESILAPEAGIAGDPVVTDSQLDAGDEVHSGTVLAEIAGRPMIALPGSFPMYRDIHPGMEGKDITQLQEALISLGFSLPTPNGVYGPATQNAVSGLYENRGYLPLESSVAQGTGSLEDGEETNHDVVDTEGGPIIAKGELSFLPSFPFVIDAFNARLGELVEGPIMDVSSGSLAATTSVSDAERELIEVGDPVTVYSESHGVEIIASIETILAPDEVNDERDTEEPVHSEGHQIIVTGDFENEMAGSDARLTIEISSTEEEVLSVPSSAIFSRHDGSTYIVTPEDEEIDVRIGISAGGWVQIETGSIQAGDPVVVSDQ
ncbi:peptidoglycan-binding protein [Nocardiopsis sp. JB363]|uniref:peptidoglycan-binding protein n=1 Tax=Nocardiopsis sp. JB363 TaxID=1434837 RepID=UPI001F39AE3C|nr:peptidoglycan-binding protein [Nocardiopsis sp. JB363]